MEGRGEEDVSVSRGRRARAARRLESSLITVVSFNEGLRRLSGRISFTEELRAQVAEVIAAVRSEGDAAVKRYTRLWDGVVLRRVRVGARSPRGISKQFREDMEAAWRRILDYHSRFAAESGIESDGEGGRWGRIVRPLDRIGIYVPGGSAPLFSTLLMAAGAARAAGVCDIVVASPPPIGEEIRAAAEVAGVTEIYAMGGAQAIAALAFGTESVRPVEKIVGPGNRYVTEAKRQVFGVVGIDMLAGPTELLVLSDGSSPAEVIAADLLAQAEHDPAAAPVLATTSSREIPAVMDELRRQLRKLPRSSIAERALGDRGMVIRCRSRRELIEVADAMAPEHLEILTRNPWEIAVRVRAAGAIFIGEFAPEVLGDYVSGPNHILPTSGTARFRGPLDASDFQRISSVQEFTRAAFRRLARVGERLARAESLEGHARSLRVRRETLGKNRRKTGRRVGR
ncbi:MAG: histidinol dehydrogenase [Candidatus Hydrogenedentota bacterium]|nr:MAG: histidinol dehydrogenase [Candidatus Hydrogenedentota bacterium]